MSRLNQPPLEQERRGQLQEYGTALAWTPEGDQLAIASAAGEIVLIPLDGGPQQVLQEADGQSIDALAISQDGQFLAAGGQAGTLLLWRLGESPELISRLDNSRTWLEHLAWHPQRNELAMGLGSYVQVWDAEAAEVVTTLMFESSSVLDLAWHPEGTQLAAGGHQGIKVWNCQDWDDDPQLYEIPAASVCLAWSNNGEYLASGNMDRTLVVWAQGNPYPWRMQGFPAKVRQLAWSEFWLGEAPLLASTSREGIVIWKKHQDDDQGWNPQLLELHNARVSAIAFQPQTQLLASASEDGSICLWQDAVEVVQLLDGAEAGFSALAWNPSGTALAALGEAGDWLIWKPGRGKKGFFKDVFRN
ncbi:MAG: hypothetical protein JJU32_11590 [Phormidium sp. BM_Day4_Bin.17]|nr:hypothetical protein [Phormidium sp. BM_Day4_Bin.17]UCJ13929.1 MAG: hypothetical protein JWS08_09485 [Phormidium sp. PBR-2020]